MYRTIIFFFNDTATTEIYTLSLHDALPIYQDDDLVDDVGRLERRDRVLDDRLARDPDELLGDAETDAFPRATRQDRKSTRLNSSHANISYAVFCLKKKNIILFVNNPNDS